MASAIIRATVKKNESLLHNKQINKAERTKVSKAKKKNNQSVSNLSKEKVERAILLSDKLEGKILKSKKRAKVVQSTRKSNWDAINLKAKEELDVITQTQTQTQGGESVKGGGEGQGDDAMDEDDDEEDFFNKEEQNDKLSMKRNAFELLGEVDA